MTFLCLSNQGDSAGNFRKVFAISLFIRKRIIIVRAYFCSAFPYASWISDCFRASEPSEFLHGANLFSESLPGVAQPERYLANHISLPFNLQIENPFHLGMYSCHSLSEKTLLWISIRERILSVVVAPRLRLSRASSI
jgi:hypothetical protein